MLKVCVQSMPICEVGAPPLRPSWGVSPDTPPFTPLKRGGSYHIWYVRTARSLNFNLAPKILCLGFSYQKL